MPSMWARIYDYWWYQLIPCNSELTEGQHQGGACTVNCIYSRPMPLTRSRWGIDQIKRIKKSAILRWYYAPDCSYKVWLCYKLSMHGEVLCNLHQSRRSWCLRTHKKTPERCLAKTLTRLYRVFGLEILIIKRHDNA